MTRSGSTMVVRIAGIALLGSTMAAAQDPRAQDRPVMVKGHPVSAVRGVWQSQGYGYVLRVDAGGTKLFHVAAGFCYAHTGSDSGVDDLLGLYRVRGPGEIAFSTDRGETLYTFRKLSDLPAACSDRTPWTRPRIAALVAATMGDLYPSFQQRGIDWRARVAAAEPAFEKIADDAALFEALKALLAGIEDPHLELHGKVGGESVEYMPGEGPTLTRIRATVGDEVMDEQDWLPAYKRGVLSAVLQGKGQERGNHRLYFGRVGDIGYLNLLAMEGLSQSEFRDDKAVLDAALDEALTLFAGTRAVIVDVSYNLGGYDGVSQHVAGRFADRRRLAFTKVAYGAHDVPPQPFQVEPSERIRYLGPVYLLTSDVTVSAGETFTLFMRTLPNVVHVGGTTRGALSDQTDKPLPNGWTLNLPAEVYRDPKGENYEVRGIPPKVTFEVFPPNDLTSGHPRAVLALMNDIRRDVPAGGPRQ